MPPKDKKKGGKKLQVLAQLTALQATYKAACKRYGVAPHKPFSLAIEDAIQESGNIDKVSFSGPDIRSPSVKAVLDCMAGYPAVKNLCMWGSSIGDEGLLAIATFIRASADRWWKGSKIRLLELVSDGVGHPHDKWAERYLAHVGGALDTKAGKGFQMPSVLMRDVDAVTADTLTLHKVGLPQPDEHVLEEELHQHIKPVTSLTYQELEDAKARRQAEEYDRRISGRAAVPSGLLPGGAFGMAGGAFGTSGGIPSAAALMASVTGRLGGLALQSAPSADAAAAGSLDHSASRGAGIGESALPPVEEDPGQPRQGGLSPRLSFQRTNAAQLPGQQSLSVRSSMALPNGSTGGAATGTGNEAEASASPAWPGSTRPSMALAAAGGDFLAGTPLDPARPLAFSAPVLRHLALGIGADGVGLQILVLDHNQFGDEGAAILASGIKRCGTLKQLSLSDCGIGPVGAAALATTMLPDPSIAETKGSGQPKFVHINLSRNPIRGAGLFSLCNGFARCSTLKVLNLSSCGLTEEDVPALGALADALAANPSIDQVDLDANFIGDLGASVFIPFLSTAKHMRKFRITARGVSRQIGGQIGEIMKGNFPKKVRKKVAAKK